MLKYVQELTTYITNNEAFVVNYGVGIAQASGSARHSQSRRSTRS